jgi:hypothetical protein
LLLAECWGEPEERWASLGLLPMPPLLLGYFGNEGWEANATKQWHSSAGGLGT